MGEAEAGMGMGWIIEGVESSWGVYGRERAGSGPGVSRRGRDWDRDRERWGGEGEREGEGVSYGCSPGVRLRGCSGLRL